jgi:hypothetical protein
LNEGGVTKKHARRGRPPKFGRRGHVIAVTLPGYVVRGLRKVHRDLGWAIVTLYDQSRSRPTRPREVPQDAELVGVAPRQSLIVVNREFVKALPGVNIIPLHDNRAFLALQSGRGMADLELAVLDRLAAGSVNGRERRALTHLREGLRTWRNDPSLRCEPRAIIVVERTTRSRARP